MESSSNTKGLLCAAEGRRAHAVAEFRAFSLRSHVFLGFYRPFFTPHLRCAQRDRLSFSPAPAHSGDALVCSSLCSSPWVYTLPVVFCLLEMNLKSHPLLTFFAYLLGCGIYLIYSCAFILTESLQRRERSLYAQSAILNRNTPLYHFS